MSSGTTTKEVLKAYELSAEQGDRQAQFVVAIQYQVLALECLDKSLLAQSEKWLKLAAEQGLDAACSIWATWDKEKTEFESVIDYRISKRDSED
jgi:TPR repeat protein